MFNVPAKYKGVSLKDKLLKRPYQFVSFYGVLLRFREGKIAILADIMDIFHKIDAIVLRNFLYKLLVNNDLAHEVLKGANKIKMVYQEGGL